MGTLSVRQCQNSLKRRNSKYSNCNTSLYKTSYSLNFFIRAPRIFSKAVFVRENSLIHLAINGVTNCLVSTLIAAFTYYAPKVTHFRCIANCARTIASMNTILIFA